MYVILIVDNQYIYVVYNVVIVSLFEITKESISPNS